MSKAKTYHKPKTPRRKFRKVSDARLAAALVKCDGGMAMAGRVVGLTRQTVHDRVSRNAALQELIQDIGVGMVDLAESTLAYRMRKFHDREAAKFILQNKGKPRGYGPQPEIPPPPPDNSRRMTIIKQVVIMMNERAAAIHKAPLDITPPAENGHAKPHGNGSANGRLHGQDPMAQLLAAKKKATKQ